MTILSTIVPIDFAFCPLSTCPLTCTNMNNRKCNKVTMTILG